MTMNQHEPQAVRPRQAGRQPTGTEARRAYERYLALARGEERSGHRIEAERFYQYAEHYLRMSKGRNEP